MGRYKDYDRGSKRGFDDNQKSPDPAAGFPSNYLRPTGQRAAPASQFVGPTTESVGTVKFYKTDKGFGFIGQDGGGKDVFVHASALARAGMTELVEGQRVRMQVGQGKKGLEARSIELLD